MNSLVQIHRNIKSTALILFCAFVFVVSKNSNAQSGYLGALNGIGLELNLGPTYRTTNILVDENNVKERLRYATLNLGINYTRVISNLLEIKGAYQYSRARALVQDNQVNPNNYGFSQLMFAEDPSVKFECLSIRNQKISLR